ncbi:MAG TPA: type II toxin-antitoxin system HicB family antitoxin [Candidatus Nanoarchaeia archaeon]|nr:type II toxin-antitoxin system HicB family antitoxin [Candidatus Nanoarchaeia archaeon]
MSQFTVIVEQGEDGYLISDVIGLPGCHTQAKTYDKLIERTKEAIKLYLNSKKLEEPMLKSVQQIDIA